MKKHLALLALCIALPGTALASTASLTIDALIDGRSQLTIQGNTAQWHHFDYAAPGRHSGANQPTTIGGVPWFPTWPDVPDAENASCNCDSSLFTGVAPPLPAFDQTVVLNPIVARGPVTIVQQPAAANGYSLIIEFNDNGPGGSTTYSVELVYQVPAEAPVMGFVALAALVLLLLLVGRMRVRRRLAEGA